MARIIKPTKRILSALFAALFSLAIAQVFSSVIAYIFERRQEKTESVMPAATFKVKSQEARAAGCGGCGCFYAGTSVAIPVQNGVRSRNIESLGPGDKVLAAEFSPLRRSVVIRKVAKIIRHDIGEYQCAEITTKSGIRIHSTANHPFIINNKNEAANARDLVPEQKILLYQDGKLQWDKVSKVRKFSKRGAVFNIELEGEPHNYLVSIDGRGFVAAHNALKM